MYSQGKVSDKWPGAQPREGHLRSRQFTTTVTEDCLEGNAAFPPLVFYYKKNLDSKQEIPYPINTMTYEMEDYLIEELEYNGKLYDANIYITFEGTVEDSGIGSYEYWGAKGVDSNEEMLVEDIEYSVVSLTDENGNKFEPAEGEIKAVQAALEKHFNTYHSAWSRIEESCNEHFGNQ